ncbi:hypothetical protein ACHAQH_003973 [Verticillium albo-atrum]
MPSKKSYRNRPKRGNSSGLAGGRVSQLAASDDEPSVDEPFVNRPRAGEPADEEFLDDESSDDEPSSHTAQQSAEQTSSDDDAEVPNIKAPKKVREAWAKAASELPGMVQRAQTYGDRHAAPTNDEVEAYFQQSPMGKDLARDEAMRQKVNNDPKRAKIFKESPFIKALWKAWIRYFKCSPDSLFSSAAYLGLDNADFPLDTIDRKVSGILYSLAGHPMWSGNQEMIQVALAYIVICRTDDRQKWPYAIPLDSIAVAEFEMKGSEKTPEQSLPMIRQEVSKNMPLRVAKPLLFVLFRRIEKLTDYKQEDDDIAAEAMPRVRALYRVRYNDVKILKQALDSMAAKGVPVFPPVDLLAQIASQGRKQRDLPNDEQLSRYRVASRVHEGRIQEDRLRTSKAPGFYAYQLMAALQSERSRLEAIEYCSRPAKRKARDEEIGDSEDSSNEHQRKKSRFKKPVNEAEGVEQGPDGGQDEAQDEDQEDDWETDPNEDQDQDQDMSEDEDTGLGVDQDQDQDQDQPQEKTSRGQRGASVTLESRHSRASSTASNQETAAQVRGEDQSAPEATASEENVVAADAVAANTDETESAVASSPPAVGEKASTPAEKPVIEPADEPADEPAGEPAGKPVNEPAREPERETPAAVEIVDRTAPKMAVAAQTLGGTESAADSDSDVPDDTNFF